MKRELPAHVYRKKGVLYFQRRGYKTVRIAFEAGTPEFHAEYARLLAGERPVYAGPRTFRALVEDYRHSPRFKRLKARTASDYDRVLVWVTDKLGPLPVDRMQRKDVIRAQSANARTVRFANYIVQVLRVLFKHAMNLGWRDDNPAKGVELLATPPEKAQEHVPWTDAAVETFRANARPLPRLIFELGIGTVQRPDDLTRFKWGDYDGSTLSLSQSKTGVRLVLPCTDQLRAALDAEKARVTPHPARPILTGHRGKPLAYRRMAELFLEERKRLGVVDHDLHALRYRGVQELTWAGCDDDEIASYSGHMSKEMIAKYAGEARQIMRARQAKEKRK